MKLQQQRSASLNLCQPQPVHIDRWGYGNDPTPPCRHCGQPINYAQERETCPQRQELVWTRLNDAGVIEFIAGLVTETSL